ncbi:MAG: helix-turn-helix domain-containing protein [Rhodanobacter sp.]|jgi:transcriptional regulator with XRE-family HTH domain|uniref:helix-turn-helix domain-containing protein n=1 Tax=Rhodanobacter sp. KK11 TaxID=3083255 RepID=UPI002965D491|nr:helix-turn-helix domain-containing protein [Rhodanobacter sp. KK11]MDW2981443.1 helix-turn-helix domain-containing protein [Rhodanobacter sp. KK11]
MAAPYEHFASRLRKALDRTDFVPGRGRTSALAARYAVSRETARKWLTGLALPELPRIIELAKDFDVSLEWLATGRGPIAPGVGETSALYRRLSDNENHLLDAFRKLPESKRQLLVKFLA